MVQVLRRRNRNVLLVMVGSPLERLARQSCRKYVEGIQLPTSLEFSHGLAEVIETVGPPLRIL